MYERATTKRVKRKKASLASKTAALESMHLKKIKRNDVYNDGQLEAKADMVFPPQHDSGS